MMWGVRDRYKNEQSKAGRYQDPWIKFTLRWHISFLETGTSRRGKKGEGETVTHRDLKKEEAEQFNSKWLHEQNAGQNIKAHQGRFKRGEGFSKFASVKTAD